MKKFHWHEIGLMVPWYHCGLTKFVQSIPSRHKAKLCRALMAEALKLKAKGRHNAASSAVELATEIYINLLANHRSLGT